MTTTSAAPSGEDTSALLREAMELLGAIGVGKAGKHAAHNACNLRNRIDAHLQRDQLAKIATPDDTTARLPPVTDPGPDGQTYYPASAANVIDRAGRYAQSQPCACDEEGTECDRCKLIDEVIQWIGARDVTAAQTPWLEHLKEAEQTLLGLGYYWDWNKSRWRPENGRAAQATEQKEPPLIHPVSDDLRRLAKAAVDAPKDSRSVEQWANDLAAETCGPSADRSARISALKGKYAGKLSSVDEFNSADRSAKAVAWINEKGDVIPSGHPVAWRWFVAPTSRDLDDGDDFSAHWEYGEEPNPNEFCHPLYSDPPAQPAAKPFGHVRTTDSWTRSDPFDGSACMLIRKEPANNTRPLYTAQPASPGPLQPGMKVTDAMIERARTAHFVAYTNAHQPYCAHAAMRAALEAALSADHDAKEAK